MRAYSSSTSTSLFFLDYPGSFFFFCVTVRSFETKRVSKRKTCNMTPTTPVVFPLSRVRSVGKVHTTVYHSLYYVHTQQQNGPHIHSVHPMFLLVRQINTRFCLEFTKVIRSLSTKGFQMIHNWTATTTVLLIKLNLTGST